MGGYVWVPEFWPPEVLIGPSSSPRQIVTERVDERSVEANESATLEFATSGTPARPAGKGKNEIRATSNKRAPHRESLPPWLLLSSKTCYQRT
jgi:hypothetical protein